MDKSVHTKMCMNVYACTTYKPKEAEFADDIRLFKVVKINRDKGELRKYIS